jgi:hypothetical protein
MVYIYSRRMNEHDTQDRRTWSPIAIDIAGQKGSSIQPKNDTFRRCAAYVNVDSIYTTVFLLLDRHMLSDHKFFLNAFNPRQNGSLGPHCKLSERKSHALNRDGKESSPIHETRNSMIFF